MGAQFFLVPATFATKVWTSVHVVVSLRGAGALPAMAAAKVCVGRLCGGIFLSGGVEHAMQAMAGRQIGRGPSASLARRTVRGDVAALNPKS
eukprot:346280-Chlamydomonas_euryale.AAC.1